MRLIIFDLFSGKNSSVRDISDKIFDFNMKKISRGIIFMLLSIRLVREFHFLFFFLIIVTEKITFT